MVKIVSMAVYRASKVQNSMWGVGDDGNDTPVQADVVTSE
jgi:hypothetical protein